MRPELQKRLAEAEGRIPGHLATLRSRVYRALSEPQQRQQYEPPILVPSSDAFGDDFLRYRAHFEAIKKFCEANELPFDPQNPPIKLSEPKKHNTGFAVWGFIESSISPFNPIMNTENRYTRNLEILSHLLGVSFSEEELHALPLPLKMNAGPLKHFDWEKITQRSKEIVSQPEHRNKQEIVIVQTGSTVWKRFNDNQIEQLVMQARQSFPDAFVTVVSDRIYDPNVRIEEIPTFGADAVLKSPDINDLGALAAIPDSLVVTTDSFPAWFMAGCKGLLPQNRGKLASNSLIDLYTLAAPESWNIPGANIVESPVLTEACENGETTRDGFLYNGGEAYKRYSPTGIPQGDIDLVKQEIQFVASQRKQQMRRVS